MVLLKPTKLEDFDGVRKIESEEGERHFLLYTASDPARPYRVDCSSVHVLESLIDLIDGYYRVSTGSKQSLWYCRPPRMPARLNDVVELDVENDALSRSDTLDFDDDYADDGDYSSLRSPAGTRELVRDRIRLEDTLGTGQFGDVFRGWYRPPHPSRSEAIASLDPPEPLPVAVKTCKDGERISDLLEEAEILGQFDHPHIVKLLGVCSSNPVWIVMELAHFGELRPYLQCNKDKLCRVSLLIYCYQLSTALSYLCSRKYVHRDIAARNVLVSSRECVKLSDFGLAVSVEGKASHIATKGKLPIKWMAPESIAYKRFTPASDVWMFGVCIWEVMMWGLKPFSGVRNSDVMSRLENGERLPLPSMCPPPLYALLMSMWTFDPERRPLMPEVKMYLQQLVLEEQALVTNQTGGFRYSGDAPSSRDSQASLPEFRPTSTSSLEPLPSLTPPPKPSRMPTLERPKRLAGLTPFASSSAGDLRRVAIAAEQRNPLPSRAGGILLLEQLRQSEADAAWLEENIKQLPVSPGLRLVSGSPNETGTLIHKPRLRVIPPGVALDRTDDEVYERVLEVVRTIADMSRSLEELDADGLCDTVKARMASKVVGSCVEKTVSATRLAIGSAETTLWPELRREVLSQAHVLAVESKQLLETADQIRYSAGVARFETPPALEVKAS